MVAIRNHVCDAARSLTKGQDDANLRGGSRRGRTRPFPLRLPSSGYGSPTAATPAASSIPSNAVVINVVAINGAQSFSPNPSSVPSGQLVVWHNVDSITHRVVLNDGELDTGNITAGSFSSPMALLAPGPYH